MQSMQISPAGGLRQLSLIADLLPQETRAPRRKQTALRKAPPVVTGGLFALTNEISPDRYWANFYSGSSAYHDARGVIAAGKDIGVAANLVRPRVAALLRSYLNQGGRCFIDSGAYTQFRRYKKNAASSPVVDFSRVFNVYDSILCGVGDSFRFNLALVMPDVIGDLELSLLMLERHRARVLEFIHSGANVIVPLQKGAQPAGQTAKRVFEILGTKNITLGIPSAAAAMAVSDAATVRHHRYHILGRGTPGLALYQRTYALTEHFPNATVSTDANQLRSKTAEVSNLHAELREDAEGDIWCGEWDDTELVLQILDATSWLTKPQVKAIAAFYGVHTPAKQSRWVNAHKSEGLRTLIEELDPECAMLYAYGISAALSGAATKGLSAKLRSKAVAQVFGTQGHCHGTEGTL